MKRSRVGYIVAFAGLVSVLALIACPGGSVDPEDVWTAMLKPCAKADQLGKDVLYFGTSNDNGPGTLWLKLASGAFQPAASFPSIVPKPDDQATVIDRGANAGCQGKSVQTKSADGSLGLSTNVVTASANVSASFKLAKSVTIGATKFRWESVFTIPYISQVTSLPAGNPIKVAFLSGQYFVETRALHVFGLTADLGYAKSVADSLKASFTGADKVAIGKASTTLQWTGANSDTLHITADDFFIAGELAQYTMSGLSSGNGTLVKLAVPAKATVQPK